jgi:hypothetical protein
MGVDSGNAIFPVLLKDTDNREVQFDDAADIGDYLIYWNERGFDDPGSTVHDVSGRRLRIIVLGGELVLCHVVPENFSAVDVSIRSVSGPGGVGHVEYVASSACRALFGDGPRLRAVPRRWDLALADDISSGLSAPTMTPREFNELWCASRDQSK